MNENILKAGTLLYNGKYRIDGVIEQGNLGITYKATLVQLDVQIAIKELFLEGKCIRGEDNTISLKSFSEKRFKQFKDKFVEEGRALARFKHPNIVQVRDIIEENNTVYLIMDYIEEQTLAAYIQEKGKLQEEEAVNYIIQIANALAEVHDKGILHKDLQPSNILITKEGKAVLVGLGVAGQFNKASHNPNYAPMEQYIAQYTKKDNSGPYTDIYALGATLYYCLASEHPLSAVQRQNSELPPPKSLNPDISTKVNQAILKAMSVMTEERQQKMMDFIVDIRPKKAMVETNADALKKGTRLLDGKYRIDSVLGQGGLGITYQATLLKLDMKIVIKELFLPGYCVREQNQNLSLQALSEKEFNRFKKQFVYEGRILAKTTHPNIVKVKDVIKENNTVYLVMEYVAGTNLQTYVQKKGRLSESEALMYIRQIANALGDVHAKNFLHKDVRPANIIINKRKQAILVGLGVEKDKVKNSNDESESGFFPMEQYASNTQLTPATDLYALAASLYFALTGQQPTSAFDRYYTELEAPQKLHENISKQTNDAIVKAMDMKSEERYQSVTAFTNDLEEIDPVELRRKRIRQALTAAAMFLTCLLAFYLVTKEPAPPTIAAKDYDKFMKIAGDFTKDGHYKKATRYYKGLLKVKPKDPKAIEGKQYAEAGMLVNNQWWSKLSEEWRGIFRKKVNFSGTPTQKDLSKIFNLSELYCNDAQVKTLEPIKNLINLKVLGCYNTAVKDLSPIANLNQLMVLDCSSTQIKNIEAVKELVNLNVLDCSKTEVTSLEAVRHLGNLQELYCSSTQVSTLDPIRELKALGKLYCAKTPIKHLEPIRDLTNLKELYVYNTRISDLEPISGLNNLNTLYCYKTSVSSLKPIAQLTNLHTLHCYNTQIKNLQALASLKNLKILHTQSTPIESLTPIKDLINIKELKCFNTQVSSLEALANLTNLEEVHCSKNPITSLAPLQNLNNLNRLYCSSTQIKNLEPLASLQNLKGLYCSSTQITDLKPIQHLQNLKELHCANLQISSLEPVSYLKNLERLDCSSTQINTLEPIAKLNNLNVLDCSSTQINDLEPLKNLRNLREVDCSTTQISSLEPVKGLNNLQTLRCENTNINQQNLDEFKRVHAGVIK